LMAHTTRLWPRRMSPAAKTPGTLVANVPCSAFGRELPRPPSGGSLRPFAEEELY
jgi:hypothetical protein